MKLWAIADPHLSFSTNKPMDIFGDHWADHDQRLAEAWRQQVAAEDVVLLPGDISWAIDLPEAEADLRFLHELPGKKLISRGNHDYWWTTQNKLRAFAETAGFDSLTFMRFEAFRFGDDAHNIVVCGTRGWIMPQDAGWKESSDRKIYERELARLEMALNAAKQQCNEYSTLLVALHYPPFNKMCAVNEVTKILNEAATDICLYGHVHGQAGAQMPEGLINGVHYHNVAADHLFFKPKLIWQAESL